MRHVPPVAGTTPPDIYDDTAALWLFEVSPQDGDLPPLLRRAITSANIVIYDRALAPVVAAALPLGGYAEPAAPNGMVPDPAIERCLGLALDGWSVVRLVDPDTAGAQRAKLSARLAARNFPDDLPVWLFTDAQNGGCRQIPTRLARLDSELTAADPRGGLAIGFGGLVTAAGRGLRAAMSNGLAG